MNAGWGTPPTFAGSAIAADLHLTPEPSNLVPPMKLPALLASFTGLLFGLSLFAAEAPKIASKEAARLVAEGKAVLVDCREPAEWNDTGVASPAVLLAKSDFDGDQKQWKDFLAKNAGKQVLVYCRTGNRSGAVSAALVAQGVNAANAGSLRNWTDAGLPVRKADAPPSGQPATSGNNKK